MNNEKFLPKNKKADDFFDFVMSTTKPSRLGNNKHNTKYKKRQRWN